MIIMTQLPRTIRSFVLRQGRMSKGQKNALTDLSGRYLVQTGEKPLDFERLYGRCAKTVLEIGFGMGQSLIDMAAASPDINFLGIEVHQPGVGHLFLGLSQNKLSNVRVVNEDAVIILRNSIADNSLSGVNIFFPDPWPKKKHHKRRLIQAEFVKLIEQKLVPGGYLHLATDWAPYAEHMLAVMSEFESFVLSEPVLHRPSTRFEKRGERLGHDIVDLVYQKQDFPQSCMSVSSP